jgi:hypothetical protein
MGFSYRDIARHVTGDVPVFGFSSDGNHTVVGTETLTTVAEYRNLTVPAGTILNTASHMVFVSGTLTIEEGGIIQCNGLPGLLGVGGAVVGAQGNTYGGQQGWDGDPLTPAYFGDVYVGGLGGDGGDGSGGAGAAHSGDSLVNPKRLSTMPGLMVPSAIALAKASTGGAGGCGDGVETGGGGGSGGGTVWLIAASVSNNGTIQANGGNGAAGVATDCGGGGGGAGGLVHLVTRMYSGNGVVQALGGTGGASGGGAGTAGTAGADGLVHIFNVPS